MTTCHNCGHDGTFVLLAQFALAIPGDPAGTVETRSDESTDALGLSTRGDWSLAVQCPACDSTDVDGTAADLFADHASSTTS